MLYYRRGEILTNFDTQKIRREEKEDDDAINSK